MALKATIYKAELTVSDMDRNHYGTYPLTIAQHPSESVLRMMVRIALFALYADDQLEFTKGLSTDDEPDLWQRSYSDEIKLWVDIGQPDEKRIRKACHRAEKVHLVGYIGNAFNVWWKQNENKCRQYDNLRVIRLSEDFVSQLESLASRTMRLQATVQDGTLWLGDDTKSIELTPDVLWAGDKS